MTRPGAVAAADRAAWCAMAAATPQFASPLLGPAFAELVGRVRDDVRVAVFTQAGEVVGVLAHHVRPGRLARPVGAPWSDAHALLTWPDRPVAWREALAAAGLRSFRFSHLVDPHGVFADVAAAAAPSHLLAEGGAEAWERLRAKSPKRFKNIRRLEHKLEREVGPLVVSEDASPAALERLVAWKRRQFVRTGAIDVLHPAWSRALIEGAAAARGAALAGRLVALHAGGRLVAAHFGLRAGAVFHPWLAGFDPELAAYSPGVVFLSRLVRAPLGIARYELSSGCDDYKAVFCEASEPVSAGAADLRPLAARPRLPRPRLIDRVADRLEHIAEVDLTLADRMHGVATAVLHAPRRLRETATAQGGRG